MDNRASILRKVKALLAKTVENGCSEAEAMAALNMAEAMIAAYEITDDDLQEAKKDEAVIEPSNMYDPYEIRWFLISRVAKFCECSTWRKKNNTKVMEFCGLRPDVEFAVWLCDTLAQFVRKEMVTFLMNTPIEKDNKRFVINSFVIGCTDRINQRLKELIDSRIVKSNSNALMVIKNQLIMKKMNEVGIRVKTMSQHRNINDHGAYEAGQLAGNKASFGRPVGSEKCAVLRIGHG